MMSIITRLFARPAPQPRPLPTNCAACGEPITDDDQVQIDGLAIRHMRCVWNRRRTIRPTEPKDTP